MTYLFVYRSSNGYTCDCCRRTRDSVRTHDFASDEEAQQFAQSTNDGGWSKDKERVLSVYKLAVEEPVYTA